MKTAMMMIVAIGLCANAALAASRSPRSETAGESLCGHFTKYDVTDSTAEPFLEERTTAQIIKEMLAKPGVVRVVVCGHDRDRVTAVVAVNKKGQGVAAYLTPSLEK